jgi:hypothetical protein
MFEQCSALFLRFYFSLLIFPAPSAPLLLSANYSLISVMLSRFLFLSSHLLLALPDFCSPLSAVCSPYSSLLVLSFAVCSFGERYRSLSSNICTLLCPTQARFVFASSRCTRGWELLGTFSVTLTHQTRLTRLTLGHLVFSISAYPDTCFVHATQGT